MLAKAVLRETFQPVRRSIGRIRLYVLTGVVRKELLENIAVVLDCVRHGIVSDQLGLHIHRDVVLISVKRLAVFPAPSCVQVFSSTLVLGPVFRIFSLLNPSVFFPAVPLLGDVHNAGIHDLTFHRHETVGPEMRVKGR